MYKIKIIAQKYLIGLLKIIGLETYPADSEAEAKKALELATAKKEPALIFISERLAVDLQEEIRLLNKKAEINIVAIPDNRGSIGLEAGRIQNLIKNSIGAEVISRR